VGVGVAEVHGHRVAPVLLEDRQQPAFDLGEGLLPRGRVPLAVALHEGGPEPVGILVQLLEGRPLRADEAGAEDVGAVAADALDGLVDQGDLQATARLAEGAGAVRGAGGGREVSLRHGGGRTL